MTHSPVVDGDRPTEGTGARVELRDLDGAALLVRVRWMARLWINTHTGKGRGSTHGAAGAARLVLTVRRGSALGAAAVVHVGWVVWCCVVEW